MVLYELTENCEFGAMKSELIRDRLVVGLLDDSLSEKLQMDSKLTLEEAVKKVRQREAVHEQHQSLRGANDSTSALETVTGSNPKRSNRRGRQQAQTQSRPNRRPTAATGSTNKRCTRCGKEQHPKDKCPARDATCHRCQRKGHYSAQCYSKTVSTVRSAEGGSPTPFLDNAFMDTVNSGTQNAWFTTIRMGEKETKFKLDTGAEVTAITQETYEHLGKPQLVASDKVLYGPSQHSLGVLGKFRCSLTSAEKVTPQGRDG